MSDTRSLFPPFGDPCPTCLLPSQFHNDGYVTLYIYQNPRSYTTQREDPNVNYGLQLKCNVQISVHQV